MTTLRRRPHEIENPPLPGLAAPEPLRLPPRPEGAGGAGAVQVIWGPMAESLELGGVTVAGAHELLRLPFHIAPDVTALVNGRPATGEQRLEPGDVLEFTRPAGEKGAG